MAAIDTLLAEARSTLVRLDPFAAAAAWRDGALLVDIRPQAQRRAEGDVPGSVLIERNVLEWRLDPTSPHCLPELLGPEQPILILCSEGYASSLAAATLRRLGLVNATDVAGGFRAWRRAGLPTAGGL
ncbi:MAG: rhodanese-like domain-containing protein [Chloroflexi bacterium]|nr:MAG: rhodanese-like domain-containing protein [Chloroflexota bacterium]TMD95419.1 MAG: rhodanese-like domain-containing protein [Chloroflexota bacterium]